jgi:hypothetical protein
MVPNAAPPGANETSGSLWNDSLIRSSGALRSRAYRNPSEVESFALESPGRDRFRALRCARAVRENPRASASATAG